MSFPIYLICFETDTTMVSSNKKKTQNYNKSQSVASSNGSHNKDAFTIVNILNMKIKIIKNDLIETLQEDYKIDFPTIKLWFFDINIDIILDLENIICIILFINGVYSKHYICNTDTIKEQKHYIIEHVIPKFRLFNQNTQNNDEFTLLINTFDTNGKTKTTVYEAIDK